MKNQEQYDISIEEFDKMYEKHVFSEKYKKNKQKMLKDYRKSVWSSTGAKTAKVAVACAAVLIASPVVANAASNYVVMESNSDGRHSCDVEKDNTAYSCGTLTGEYVMQFNRLVDTDQISSITVNDVEYTLE